MRTTKMIRNRVLALTFLLGFPSLAAAEYRCGWLDNPSPDQYRFTDKQATWAIMERGGYRIGASSLKNLPALQPNEFVRTNGSYGYSCSCMSVKTDARTKRITSIVYKGKQVLLKRCLEDKAIADHMHAALRFPGPPINRPASRNARQLAATSGSYTDKPVIEGQENTESETGYFDRPKVDDKKQVAKRKSRASGRSKSHYIQVIVTSIPAKAKRLKRNFDKAGFKTVINGVKIKGKLLHKVRVGPYPNRQSALKNQAKLRKSFRKDQGVQKSIIVG